MLPTTPINSTHCIEASAFVCSVAWSMQAAVWHAYAELGHASQFTAAWTKHYQLMHALLGVCPGCCTVHGMLLVSTESSLAMSLSPFCSIYTMVLFDFCAKMLHVMPASFILLHTLTDVGQAVYLRC